MEALKNQNHLSITHVYHSGVLINTVDKLLIFDYFHEEGAFNQREFLQILKQHSDKDFYYFVTHGHGDHFSPEILTENFRSMNGTTHYIFSEDVAPPEMNRNQLTFCKPDDFFIVNDVKIRTFASTDQGVSYLVELPSVNKLLFHSGDLNWWHWKSFSPKEQQQEKNDFLDELNKLKTHLTNENAVLDIGFIPVDPRLEEFFSLAANAFLETIKPQKLFPLHFRSNYSITQAYKSQCHSPEQFQTIHHPLETFIMKD